MSRVGRALIAIAIFVVAFAAALLVAGGIAYLAGLGIGQVEAAILAVVAVIVTVVAMRRIRLPP